MVPSSTETARKTGLYVSEPFKKDPKIEFRRGNVKDREKTPSSSPLISLSITAGIFFVIISMRSQERQELFVKDAEGELKIKGKEFSEITEKLCCL